MKNLFVFLLMVFMITGHLSAKSKVEKLIEKAFACHEKADFTCLLDQSNAIIKKDPREPLGYYFRAMYYWEKNAFDSAITDLLKASRLDPEDADYLTMLGNIYYEQQKTGSSRYYLFKALALDSLNKDALILLADIDYYVDGGKDTVYLNQLARLEPDHYYLEYRKGLAYYYQENFQLAIKHLEKAIYLDPEFDVAYYYRGLAMMHMGAIDPALQSMAKAIEIYDQDHLYHHMQGYLYIEKEDYRSAIASSRKALALNPQYANSWYNLAYSQMKEKQYPQALESIAQCFKYGDEPEDYYYLQGDIKYYMLDDTAGCADWQKALEHGKTEAVEDLIHYCPDYEPRTSL